MIFLEILKHHIFLNSSKLLALFPSNQQNNLIKDKCLVFLSPPHFSFSANWQSPKIISFSTFTPTLANFLFLLFKN